jgi:hypothetical protein
VSQALALAGILLAMFALLILTTVKIRYIIDDDTLTVKIWLLPYCRIPIAEIRKISRSYSFISAPAASMTRILLRMNSEADTPVWKLAFAKKSYMLMLSPENEQEFVAELKRINPDIEVCIADKPQYKWQFWKWEF